MKTEVTLFLTACLAFCGPLVISAHPSPRSFPCPEPEDIAPCLCTALTNGELVLDCSKVSSDEQLASVFQQHFPVTNFNSFLLLDNTHITNIGNDFNEVTFQDVSLNYVPNLLHVSNFLFESSKNTLQQIYIFNSKLSEETFPIWEIDRLTNLFALQIHQSHFKALPQLNSKTLEIFEVTNANVSSLHSETFHKTTKVSTINLHGNQIGTIEAKTFKLQDGGNSIDIGDNLIGEIAHKAFVLPATTESLSLELRLYNNRLTTLDEGVFGSVFPYVTRFSIQGNPLECGCDLVWLMSSPAYWSTVTYYSPSCADGRLLADLDLEYYSSVCA